MVSAKSKFTTSSLKLKVTNAVSPAVKSLSSSVTATVGGTAVTVILIVSSVVKELADVNTVSVPRTVTAPVSVLVPTGVNVWPALKDCTNTLESPG